MGGPQKEMQNYNFKVLRAVTLDQGHLGLDVGTGGGVGGCGGGRPRGEFPEEVTLELK